MLRAHLGLGSNLGDRWAYLGRAVERLVTIDPGTAVSPVYETIPQGGPPGQGPYLNAVARLACDLAPAGVLELAMALERDAGRSRGERWAARSLDVDVLFLEELDGAARRALVVDTPSLVVPHPLLAERAFVLAPLEDCSPELLPARWRDRFGGPAAVDALVRRVAELVLVAAP